MNEDALLQNLRTISKEVMEDGKFFHDYAHAYNVYKNVEALLEHEQGDRLVLLTAALFHDVKRDVKDHDKAGAKTVSDILAEVKDFPKEKIDEVSSVISAHEEGQVSQNDKIFSDADKMDAFTELGIARGFMMFAKWGYTLQKACVDYLKYLDQWYENLHTQTARKLAKTGYKKVRESLNEMIQQYDY